MLGVSNLLLSTIFILYFRAVPKVCGVLVFHLITARSSPNFRKAHFQLLKILDVAMLSTDNLT